MVDKGNMTVIRGVDSGLWRHFRARAVEMGVAVGVLLNEVIKEWLEKRKEGK